MPASSTEHAPAPRRRAMPPVTDRRSIALEAHVVARVKDGLFELALDNGHRLHGFLPAAQGSKLSKEVLPEDRVVVEVPSFDLSHGRIIRHSDQGRAAAPVASTRSFVVA